VGKVKFVNKRSEKRTLFVGKKEVGVLQVSTFAYHPLATAITVASFGHLPASGY